MQQELTSDNVILIINTIFTFLTPLVYMILKMIKKCQFGNNAYIETRSDGSGSQPQSATNTTPLVRLQSLFNRNFNQQQQQQNNDNNTNNTNTD